jgi:hypothetical protein
LPEESLSIAGKTGAERMNSRCIDRSGEARSLGRSGLFHRRAERDFVRASGRCIRPHEGNATEITLVERYQPLVGSFEDPRLVSRLPGLREPSPSLRLETMIGSVASHVGQKGLGKWPIGQDRQSIRSGMGSGC